MPGDPLHISRTASPEPVRIDPFDILERLPTGVLVCTVDRERGYPLVLVNDIARRLLDLPVADHVSEALSLEHSEALEYGEPLASEISRAARSGHPRSYEWSCESRTGSRCLASRISVLDSDSESATTVLCILEDRTSERRTENNLLYHALHDGLTGLPNRSYFLNRLEEIIAQSQACADCQCGVMIVNVDRFQLINEEFGHGAGDSFLTEIANSLKSCLRGNDVLARFNGDEFAILIDDIDSIGNVARLAERIHASMSAPRMVSDTETLMTVSIGIATTLGSPKHPEDLIRDADSAMHEAKAAGRAETRIYQRDRSVSRKGQLLLESALRRAVEREEMMLHYQPILDLASYRIIGFEALMRWNDPDKGMISPVNFIPLAEDTGLILPLGRWAIREACRTLAGWRAQGAPDSLRVNVNLSARQLLQNDIVSDISDALDASGLPGSALRLEITETVLVANPAKASQILSDIRAMGASLALDDFGTGYSSLNYLSSFPIDCIKIDRSFVVRMEDDTSVAKILRIIAMMADSFGMSLVAEGIEEDSQRAMLMELGCRQGQGFLFDRPLAPEDAARRLGLDQPTAS